jgi:hypothetical protein
MQLREEREEFLATDGTDGHRDKRQRDKDREEKTSGMTQIRSRE